MGCNKPCGVSWIIPLVRLMEYPHWWDEIWLWWMDYKPRIRFMGCTSKQGLRKMGTDGVKLPLILPYWGKHPHQLWYFWLTARWVGSQDRGFKQRIFRESWECRWSPAEKVYVLQCIIVYPGLATVGTSMGMSRLFEVLGVLEESHDVK